MKKKQLPHDDVYARLGVSKIHGIGVIAIIDIPKGTDPFKYDYGSDHGQYYKFPAEKLMKGLKPAIKKLYDDFCVFEDNNKTVWTPKSFNSISVGWYLNHSREPNMRAEPEGEYFFALRDIKAGEELTVDYSTYSDH